MSADVFSNQNLLKQALGKYQPRPPKPQEHMRINPLLTIGLAMAAGISAVRDRGHNVGAFATGLLIGIAFRAGQVRKHSMGA
jgi:hypothetical protein